MSHPHEVTTQRKLLAENRRAPTLSFFGFTSDSSLSYRGYFATNFFMAVSVSALTCADGRGCMSLF